MRVVTSVVLVLGLFACPMVCAWGHAAGGEAAGEKGVCDCCRHGSSGTGEGCPADGCPEGPQSPGQCQCICGGAVLGDIGSVELGPDLSWSLPVVLVDAGEVSAAECREFWMAAPWPDVGMNRGRWVCCLFCTYLC